MLPERHEERVAALLRIGRRLGSQELGDWGRSIESWHLVELVEHVMPTQPERFTLHLEIPAVPDRVRAEIAPRRELTFAVGPGCATHPLTHGGKLADQRFERAADALQSGHAFFLQLPQ